MPTPTLETLLPLALDMTASLSSEDRRRRLVERVASVLPCDAVALLAVRDGALEPVAAVGLSDDLLGRRFVRDEHPRLDAICASEDPTRFPADSPLPDPYDGMVLAGAVLEAGHVHSCLGCPLLVEGELVGVLTADALEPGAFDALDDAFLAYLAALAGASLRTSALIDRLAERAELSGQIAQDLVRDVMERRGAAMVGDSPALTALQQELELVAPTDLPVLVTGETGVGKELVVRMLHARSGRAGTPLVYVNCAALPESVVESELFGHVRGAFTGAERERLGKFRAADGATLFLDELGELPLAVQPKLLRALQEGEIQQVGADEPLRVDVRLLAATNRDLGAEVAAGRFRADLLHRLDVCRLAVPPLRERPEDVAPLAGHFADRARSRLGTGPLVFEPAALAELRGGSWPGNVRELENVVSRAILRASARVEPGRRVVVERGDLDAIAPRDVRASDSGTGGERPARTQDAPPGPLAGIDELPLREAVRAYQRARVRAAVEDADGNWSAAARALGVDRANLHHRARRLGLK